MKWILFVMLVGATQAYSAPVPVGGTSSGGSMPRPAAIAWVIPQKHEPLLSLMTQALSWAEHEADLKQTSGEVTYPNGATGYVVCGESSSFEGINRLSSSIKLNDLPLDPSIPRVWRGVCRGDNQPHIPETVHQLELRSCAREAVEQALWDSCQSDVYCRFRTTSELERETLIRQGWIALQETANYHRCGLEIGLSLKGKIK